jgi:hypothetical protein
MKLLFSIQNQIHTFQVQEEIFPQDLNLLKSSMIRFFESNPPFAVLDLSQSSLQVSDSELQSTLLEIKTHAQARNLHLSIAQSDIESDFAYQNVIESALLKRAKILETKLELREKLKADALRMIGENEKLKSELQEKLTEKKQQENSVPHKLSPFMEKLWSDKA